MDLKINQNPAKLVISENIDAIFDMIKKLYPKENIGTTDPAVPPEIIIEEEKIMKKSKWL